MRILILGAGATGGYFGARLLEAGADVNFLVRASRAAQLRAHGLVIESRCGNFKGAVAALSKDDIGHPYDLVILSCKAYDLERAADAIVPAIGPSTLVLPLLNGLKHFDPLDERFGAERIAGGCCHLAVALGEAGEVRHLNTTERITFGARGRGAENQRRMLERLAVLFARTSVDCRFVEDVMQHCWEKYVFIATLAAVSTLMRAAVGDVVSIEGGRGAIIKVLEVCALTAAHNGFPMRPNAYEEALATLSEQGSALTASMLRDLEAGGRVEAEQIVGDMMRRAQAAGLGPGLLGVAYMHLRAREARRMREFAGSLG